MILCTVQYSTVLFTILSTSTRLVLVPLVVNFSQKRPVSSQSSIKPHLVSFTFILTPSSELLHIHTISCRALSPPTQNQQIFHLPFEHTRHTVYGVDPYRQHQPCWTLGPVQSQCTNNSTVHGQYPRLSSSQKFRKKLNKTHVCYTYSNDLPRKANVDPSYIGSDITLNGNLVIGSSIRIPK